MNNTQLLIESLYENLLGRSADKAGSDDKIDRLDRGLSSINQVINEILTSDEFCQKLPDFNSKFSKASSSMFTNNVSQFGEIELLINHWVRDIAQVPIVVDVGARGKERSNSWDLLKYFGFRGLLVEANALLVPQIKKDFGGLDYKLISCAVSNYEGEAEFTIGVNDDVSSLEAKAAEAWGQTKGIMKVQVQKLPNLLKRENIPHNFFLLSLDIEGEDIKVFNDLVGNSKYRPKFVIIEASYDFATKSLDDIPLLDSVKKSYQLIGQTKANLILKLI